MSSFTSTMGTDPWGLSRRGCSKPPRSSDAKAANSRTLVSKSMDRTNEDRDRMETRKQKISDLKLIIKFLDESDASQAEIKGDRENLIAVLRANCAGSSHYMPSEIPSVCQFPPAPTLGLNV